MLPDFAEDLYSAFVRFVLKKVLGIVLVLVGVLALFTPLTPGSWLALIGFELLGLSFLFPRRVREPWEKMKEKLQARIRQWWQRSRGGDAP